MACKRAIEVRDSEWDRLDRAFCYTVLEARQNGYRFADIGRATGMSVEGIRRVVVRAAKLRKQEMEEAGA